MKRLVYGLVTGIFTAILLLNPASAQPPGLVISNQASLDFINGAGVPTTVVSNTVDVTTAVIRSPSSLELTRVVGAGTGTYQETVGPSACFQGGSFVNLADPVLSGGTTIDPTMTQDVNPTSAYNLGEPVFIRLNDTDQNLDYVVIDYAVVTVTHALSGDSESIRLTETGINTGIFAGYVPTQAGAAIPGDCLLQGSLNSTLTVSYTDPADAADSSQQSADLDPVGIVFESRTGTPLDGATVELVVASTGLPASVFGNDGVSSFPATIVTGSTETDSSGATYPFGNGEYRFPVVPAGSYRLIVTPPSAYSAPSTVSISDLQMLPGAPYALGPPSFGQNFNHTAPLSFVVDIPVDPLDSALFLQKSTQSTVVAPGDFVRYQLNVENTSTSGIATGVRIVDQLPAGVRYIPASATRDGVAIADPLISSDLRALEFPIGDLNAGERVQIHYVIEVITGTRDDQLVNTATAVADAGLISNDSSAVVRLTEDLFRSTATIIGRVVEGVCTDETFAEDQGIANIRVYLEDGRYAVTDAGGRYHFEGLIPGTRVAQLDRETVPEYYDVIGCATSTDFAGRSDSQFVKLSKGSLKRADFYLRRKEAPVGNIDIELLNVAGDSAEEVTYIAALNGTGNVRIRNLSLMLLLPDGVSYTPGTFKLDGRTADDPRVQGPSLTAALPDQQDDWTSTVEFSAQIDAEADGELTTKALARFETPAASGLQTPVVETRMLRAPAESDNEGYVLNLTFGVLSAQLSLQDRIELDRLVENWQGVYDVQIAAVGHSDSFAISPANQHLFADNYVLSRARARAAASYVAQALNVPDGNIQVEGRGPREPVASNATAAGRQMNRRVEMILSGMRPTVPSFLEVTLASSGTQIMDTKGAVPGSEEERLLAERQLEQDDDSGMPTAQYVAPLNTLSAGAEILLPAADFRPAIPVTKIAIKHKLQQRVNVSVNGAPISPLTFDGLSTDQAKTFAVSQWNGVGLQDGVNDIRVEIFNADGSGDRVLKRSINYAGSAMRGELVPDMSILVADGRTRPMIAVKLFDRASQPARQRTVGAYRVDAPYRAWWEVENSRKNPIVTIGNREPTYRVGANGIAYIELEPTTAAGEVQVHLKFENQREQELRVWLAPEPRDWILVGFAEGTVGYNTLSENISAATEAGFEDGYYDDGRVAFFAKGQLKGEYLLTLAYDSAREYERSEDIFETEVDPNAYYAIYADSSEQRFEAASQRKLYVKLERGQFSAMFGDFDTGLSVTELARYERRFNGIKSDFRGENVGYTVFATETDQSFVRDEIRGDGTSGLYRLSSAPIIINSETIRIEVRDRFDTGQVLSSNLLRRFLDYNLNPRDGTIYFKQPIQSRDADFNTIFIVAEYESRSDANEGVIAGGRGSLHFAANTVEVGATHINEDIEGAEAELTGVDLRWQVNPETLVTAEIATSNRVEAGNDLEGTAASLTIEHQGETVDVRAYFKEVEQDFGLGQQNTSEKGIRKVGLDGRGQLSERFFLNGEAVWQQNLETEAIRTTVLAQLRYENGNFTATSGIIHNEDDFDDGDVRSSDLVDLGVSQLMFDGRLNMRVNGSFAMSQDAESLDFPTRIVAGADFKLVDGVDLFAEFEDAKGQDVQATMSRLGIRTTPWARAQFNTTLNSQSGEFGPRLFANVGLVQGFQLNDNWVLDIGLDQTNTLLEPGARPFDPDRELVSGSFNDDFIAGFIGAAYNSELWSANGRFEMRNSDSEESTSIFAGWYREPTLGHGMSAGLTMFSSENISGVESTVADFKFGWAWRKADGRWSFLNRIDLILEETILTDQSEENRKIINNFNANRRFSENTELSLQYAFKYVSGNFDDLKISGYTDLIGVDYRHGFNSRWDTGIHTSVYHSYESSVIDYGLGVDIGFNMRDNMWLSLGYNFTGFHDSDFSAARYTAEGPYLQLSIKADQQTLKDIAGQR